MVTSKTFIYVIRIKFQDVEFLGHFYIKNILARIIKQHIIVVPNTIFQYLGIAEHNLDLMIY